MMLLRFGIRFENTMLLYLESVLKTPRCRVFEYVLKMPCYCVLKYVSKTLLLWEYVLETLCCRVLDYVLNTLCHCVWEYVLKTERYLEYVLKTLCFGTRFENTVSLFWNNMF